MTRAVIRVPRVDSHSGNGTNGNSKQRSSLTSPKAHLAQMQSDVNQQRGARWVPMDCDSKEKDHGFNKVPSLMFDMEDTHDEKDLQWGGNSVNDTLPSAASLDRLQSLVQARGNDEEMLAMHVNYALSDALERNGSEMDTAELGDRLRTLGYSVTLRTALGGDSIGGNASCLRNLRHSFLAVSLPNSQQTSSAMDKVFIVDPKFLDQFEIAHSTLRYDAFLDVLPSAIVVPAIRLTEAVRILCEEMARAFEKTGTPVPPWRQANAMLSKWQPRRSADVPMTWQHRQHARSSPGSKDEKYPLATIVEKHYGGAAAASREGFCTRVEKLEDASVNHKSNRRVSTTPDQADLEAVYSSDDMTTDGKNIWPGYRVLDFNNLVSEYVSLSV
jgi:uncharacterized protein (TIGR01615 family)